MQTKQKKNKKPNSLFVCFVFHLKLKFKIIFQFRVEMHGVAVLFLNEEERETITNKNLLLVWITLNASEMDGPWFSSIAILSTFADRKSP